MQTAVDPEQYELFELLKAKDHEKAWDHFVKHYASRAEQAVLWKIRERDAACDALVYVLERLKSDDMKRIRKYRGERSLFGTFLSSITLNLLRDYFRKKDGRFYYPRALKRKPEQFRKMYLYHMRGRTYTEIYGMISAEYPGVFADYPAFMKEMVPLTALNANKRRKAAYTAKKNVPLDGEHSGDIDVLLGMSTNPEGALLKSETRVKDEEMIRHIQRILDAMPPADRLMFTLFYTDGLSHKEIEAMMHIAGTAKKLWTIRAFIRKELKRKGISYETR